MHLNCSHRVQGKNEWRMLGNNHIQSNPPPLYHGGCTSLVIHTFLEHLGLMFEAEDIAEDDPYRALYARSNMKGDATQAR